MLFDNRNFFMIKSIYRTVFITPNFLFLSFTKPYLLLPVILLLYSAATRHYNKSNAKYLQFRTQLSVFIGIGQIYGLVNIIHRKINDTIN